MYELTAEQIIAALTGAEYMTGIGYYKTLYIQATLDDDTLTFHHNLGASNVPTKKEAAEIIRALQEYYQKLSASSADFRRFVRNRAFEVELYVFSGQMDFRVAVCRGDTVTWLTDLD